MEIISSAVRLQEKYLARLSPFSLSFAFRVLHWGRPHFSLDSLTGFVLSQALLLQHFVLREPTQ